MARNKIRVQLDAGRFYDITVATNQRVVEVRKVYSNLNDGRVFDINANKKAIQELSHNENKDISEIAKIIIKLRTVDKWLSTYIDGVLNKIIEEDGIYKLHTSINNNGTVSEKKYKELGQLKEKKRNTFKRWTS